MAAAAAVAALSAYQLQAQEIAHLKATEAANRELVYKRDFEQTFFNLLKLLRQAVREIEYRDGDTGKKSRGREALYSILYLVKTRTALQEYKNLDEKETIDRAFRRVYNAYKDELGHYFRLFYHVLRYIDESSVADKRSYTRMLRATLSNSEMCLIGLNCAHGGGKEKLTPLIGRYQMLHNISAQSASDWLLPVCLPESVFGDRRFRK